MAVAIFAGGAIFGVLLYSPVMLLDKRELATWRGLEVLYDVAFSAAAGGILAIIEAVSPSLPLAWLLGLFGNRAAARSG